MPSTAHSLTTAAGTVQRLPVRSTCIEHAELRSPYGGQIMITLTQESFIFRSAPIIMTTLFDFVWVRVVARICSVQALSDSSVRFSVCWV